MAWTDIIWRCGHKGQMQLYGKTANRGSRVAFESGRNCMVCWLLDQWQKTGDPRANREDSEKLAVNIAKGKDIRIWYRDKEK